MARSDLLVQLVESGTAGDSDTFHRVVMELAAEERRLQHHVLADRLLRGVRRGANGHARGAVVVRRADGLIEERSPDRTLDELWLSDEVC